MMPANGSQITSLLRLVTASVMLSSFHTLLEHRGLMFEMNDIADDNLYRVHYARFVEDWRPCGYGTFSKECRPPYSTTFLFSQNGGGNDTYGGGYLRKLFV